MTDDKLMAGARWLRDLASEGGSQIKPHPALLALIVTALERDITIRAQISQVLKDEPPKLYVNGSWHQMMSPDLSDDDVAVRVRMLFRDELEHEYVCTLARDRILSLSQRLAALAAIHAGAASTVYLIWSNEHRAWWRPGRAGYTTFLIAAGRYSQADAVAICRDARGGWTEGNPPPEIPVREADALASEVRV